MQRLLKLVLSELRSDILQRNIVVREASLDDELGILAIRNHPDNYKWFFYERSISAEEHAEWFKTRLLDAQFFTLVAVVDGGVIGTAYLSDLKFTVPKVSISVKPDSQAKGVGTKLLKELVSRSKSASLDSIVAKIKSSNLDSIRFFSQNGFILANVDSKKTGTIQADVITLSLNLTD